MTNPAFDQKNGKPEDASLEAVLGKTKTDWDAIVDYLDGCDGVTREWKFYGAKHGWQLKAVDGKRALVYLIPHDGSFTAALAFKADELARVRASDLPKDLISTIESAKAYAEGTPARVEVSGKSDAGIVERLLALRLGGAATSRCLPARGSVQCPHELLRTASKQRAGSARARRTRT